MQHLYISMNLGGFFQASTSTENFVKFCLFLFKGCLCQDILSTENCPWCSEHCPTGTSVPASFYCYSVSCRVFFQMCSIIFQKYSKRYFREDTYFWNGLDKCEQQKSWELGDKKLSPSSLEGTDSPKGNGADTDLLPAQCLVLRYRCWEGIKDTMRGFHLAQESPGVELGRTAMSAGRNLPLQLPNKIKPLLTGWGIGAISHSIWATTAPYHIKMGWSSKDQRHLYPKPFDSPVVIQPFFHDNGGNLVNKWIIFIGLFTRCWWKVVSKCLQEHLHWSGLLFVVWIAD